MTTETGKAIVKLIKSARRRLVCAENDVVRLRATLTDLERKVATLDAIITGPSPTADQEGPK
jgi:hypothetical protein